MSIDHRANFLGPPLGPVMPDLSKIEYKIAQTPTFFENSRSRPTYFQQLLYKARQVRSNFIRYRNRRSALLNLPQELILLIASHLPDASRASFAVTCTPLLSINSDATLFTSLQLPTEQPPNFQSVKMIKPQIYQPARWEFLRFLELDLKWKWQLCTECFVLHPRATFIAYHNSPPTHLKSYYNRHASEHRSCRHDRKDLAYPRIASYVPTGIVDLCPCIKLTWRKKRDLEAQLRANAKRPPGSDPPIAADFWWHQCSHRYGAGKLDIRIGLFLYDGSDHEEKQWQHHGRGLRSTHIISAKPLAGQLGAVIEYRHTYPADTVPNTSMRLLCPHRRLDEAVRRLRKCAPRHGRPGVVCWKCKNVQFCFYCRTKVLDISEEMEEEPGMTTWCYRVERCLEDRIWPMQTVFPFARRQVPLFSRSLLPWVEGEY